MDSYPFDSKMRLSDGAAAYTANGIAQVGAANRILNLGAPLPRTDLGIVGELARMKVAVVIDISAMVTVNTDNAYDISIMGSNVADGTKPVVLGGLRVGNFTLIPNGSAGSAATGAGSTSANGRFIIFADMVQNDVAYQYLYLFNTVAGTAKSITYTAFAAAWPTDI